MMAMRALSTATVSKLRRGRLLRIRMRSLAAARRARSSRQCGEASRSPRPYVLPTVLLLAISRSPRTDGSSTGWAIGQVLPSVCAVWRVVEIVVGGEGKY
jgi:hypothetical protein